MDQTEFHAQLLGLEEPWEVDGVELDVEGGKVEIFLAHDDGCTWSCPGCGDTAPLHDHAGERTWRHLDTCQLKTLLKARLPRVRCSSCGVRQVKGQVYDTLVYDLGRSAVLYIGEKRETESLAAYYRGLSEEELAGIEAVAMDMWPAYYAATVAHVPGAAGKIVYDRFHIAKHAGEAVDKVRREEAGALSAIGAGFLLGGTRNDWLYSEENLPEHRRENFLSLQGINLKTSRAWAIKETLRGLWSYRSKGWARRFFKKWYAWAIRSRLEPIERLAKMVARHIDNILTYCEHPITNAVAEGVNSKIMSIKRQSSGFRNRDNFKTVVYFYCGKLKTDPLESA